MRLTHSTRDFAVFDDVLEPAAFEALWQDIQSEPYRSVHAARWDKSYHFNDGNPLEGPLYLSHPVEAEGKTFGAIDKPALRSFVASLLAASDRFDAWVGPRARDWQLFTARPCLFPANALLSWHSDGRARSGAYSYYAHPEWRARWGGELMFADVPDALLASPQPVSALDDRRESALLMEHGFGTYVAPKPNRLVVLRAGVMHSVRRVECSAGDHVRAAISGFFVRDVEALLSYQRP